MDTLITPQLTRRMFVASTVMMIVAVALSAFNAASVISAPRYTTVGVPQTVGFEGFLAQANGQPIANGTYNLTFAIYDVAAGGASLWSETQNNIQITNGLYSVALGAVNPTGFVNSLSPGTSGNTGRWIGVTVGTGGSEISPRTQISSVPFALNAINANKINGAETAGMIALFDTATDCPAGWSEYTAARGRVVVGVVVNGTVGGTKGTALTDLEDRAHTHTVPAHTHNISPGGWGATDISNNPAYAGYTLSWHGIGDTTVATSNKSTDSGGGGNSGAASISQIIPYIQLRYCKLNP